ncbi:MAG: hypothetical protein LC768_07125, partial [Acidobacteria bacterium]|nr:hypothetical protein [Acidobacteriota bacterium]MCA1638095.1 hypothetical protein [Acidobacteriota bacterium]
MDQSTRITSEEINPISERKVIRWASAELPACFCGNYTDANGLLVTSFENDALECIITLDALPKTDYLVFHIGLLNKSEKHFVVKPSDFLIRVT